MNAISGKNIPAEVLIVGAGPTGLVLALWLTKAGVTCRIIERNAGPGEASRAMVVQARTLEFYQQLGIANDVVRSGIKINTVRLREGREEVASFDINAIGKDLSPFPYVLSFPQDDHERLLVKKLAELGIEVEWNTELTNFEQQENYVRATLISAEKNEIINVPWLCGCDGAGSTVRKTLDLEFQGGTYKQNFFVADISATGGAANGDLNMCLGADRFCLILPVRSTGMQRLIGVVPPEVNDLEDLNFSDIQPYAEKLIGIKVDQVNWFSSYQVHHRVATAFRSDRVFLAGDSAHIHSPAGGQGMNTGIGDAVNLAWKLAAVIQKNATLKILDSYEPERIAFARTLVETTDRVFTSVVKQGLLGKLFREIMVPNLMPFLLGFDRLKRVAFRTISQAKIHYPDSPLSEGELGNIAGGDRLPWFEHAGNSNYEPLTLLDWQIHYFGAAPKSVSDIADKHRITVCECGWGKFTKSIGFQENAAYLARPDGYLAIVCPESRIEQLAQYLERFSIYGRT